MPDNGDNLCLKSAHGISYYISINIVFCQIPDLEYFKSVAMQDQRDKFIFCILC